MWITRIAIWLLGCLSLYAIVAGQEEEEYVAPGGHDSVSLERALDEFLPRYVWGVGLSPKKLERGMRKDRIPPPYVSKIETWISRVLRPEFKPKDPKEIVMLGVPKLHYNRDYIVGRVGCGSCDAPDKTKAVEFQADDRRLDLTIHSAKVKGPVRGVFSTPEMVSVVRRFLNIPEDKVPSFTAEHHVAGVDGVRVYYGKLNCEWVEGESRYKDRRWWSEIPFWMMDGKVCLSISTIDWERGETPPASVNAGLDLSGSIRTDER